MTASTRISPAFAANRLYPSRTAYMARTDLGQTRMIGFKPYNLDAVTTLLMGIINGHASVRHRCCTTDEILSLFDRAGIEVTENLRVYESAEQAERHADELIEEGYRLMWPYPLREGRFADDVHIVRPSLWKYLNAKQNLGELVPESNLAPRRVWSLDQLAERSFERPVFLKAAGDAPTGSGYAVRYCADGEAWSAAIASYRSLGEVDRVIVEEEVPVSTCWCVSIAVDSDRTTYIGAAEQVFSAPAKQSGSVIDHANPFPKEGAALAVLVGDAARRRGFVGLAGLDIGLTTDNRLIVFDPNFRFNASTCQVLLHDAAAERCGFSASVFVHVAAAMGFGELARRVRGPIDDHWFVPTRFIDGALLPAAEGKAICTGFVLGANRAEAFERRSELEAILTA